MLLLVAAAYAAAARAGLALDAVSGFATLVWPASGIALAAILLGGYAMWPAIAAGAFIANYTTGAPPIAALAIAFGNTAEPLLGAYLLRRIPGFRNSLDRVQDVLALLVLAAVLSTMVSATVGVTALRIADIVPAARFGETWRAWWVGDAIGDLLVAPALLTWATWNRTTHPARRLAEAALLGTAVVTSALVVFGIPRVSGGTPAGWEYLIFPPLIWAALRFGVRGAVTSVLIVAIIAIAQTALGRGPFIRPELYQSLFALQTFMGISGATFLLLGASISERRRAANELRAARESAEAANRSKAGFLAVVSHELRTPLNAITGYVDLLSLGVDGPLNDKQRATLDRIAQNQRHLLTLIEDVLSFAQAEAGRLSFALQPVRVCDMLASAEAIVAPQVERKGLVMHVQECDQDLSVNADPDRLMQVLLNIVTNAIKFTPSGGRIELTADVHDDTVRIAITDTGIGIPADQLDRVFDPFFQVEQGGTRRYPGVGLGLSIVRESIEAMDGSVGIESEVGKGTTVFVALERCRAAT